MLCHCLSSIQHSLFPLAYFEKCVIESFIMDVSVMIEFNNSSTTEHHNKNRPLTGLFFMLQILCKSKIIEPNGEIYG